MATDARSAIINGIKSMKIKDRDMLFIPKFYVKQEKVTTGPYKGGNAYLFDLEGGEGWHLHPAFIFRSKSAKNGLLIDKNLSLNFPRDITSRVVNEYEAWPNGRNAPDISNWNTSGVPGNENWGWRLYSIYEWSLLRMIAILEHLTLDLKKISDEKLYHGINFKVPGGEGKIRIDMAGNNEYPLFDIGGFMIDGLRFLKDKNSTHATPKTMRLFDPAKMDSKTWIDTGITEPASGFSKGNFNISTVNGVNFGDLFIDTGKKVTESEGFFKQTFYGDKDLEGCNDERFYSEDPNHDLTLQKTGNMGYRVVKVH